MFMCIYILLFSLQLVSTQPYAAAGYAAATRYAIPTVATAATYAAGWVRFFQDD